MGIFEKNNGPMELLEVGELQGLRYLTLTSNNVCDNIFPPHRIDRDERLTLQCSVFRSFYVMVTVVQTK